MRVRDEEQSEVMRCESRAPTSKEDVREGRGCAGFLPMGDENDVNETRGKDKGKVNGSKRRT